MEDYCTVCGIIAELDEGLCEDCWYVAREEDPTLMFELVDVEDYVSDERTLYP